MGETAYLITDPPADQNDTWPLPAAARQRMRVMGREFLDEFKHLYF